jgi:hypothetical protein
MRDLQYPIQCPVQMAYPTEYRDTPGDRCVDEHSSRGDVLAGLVGEGGGLEVLLNALFVGLDRGPGK